MYARFRNKTVLVVDYRDHIGGNCFDYIDKETGILMNKWASTPLPRSRRGHPPLLRDFCSFHLHSAHGPNLVQCTTICADVPPSIVRRYGAHLFHTDKERVWRYVHRFAKWLPYQHRVIARVDDVLVPIPANINTVRSLVDPTIDSPATMARWLRDIR